VIGYFCGCLLTAELTARRACGKSAFLIGTGNPGTANIMRLFGPKWAALTLLGDIGKTFFACLLCRYLLFPGLGGLAVLYAGVGACLGHGFPFWHRFRGGRSVAVTSAYIFVFSPLWGLTASVAGLFIVFASRFLAIGALAIPSLFLIPTFLLYGKEAGFVMLAGTAATFALHRDSIARMLRGEEDRLPPFTAVLAKLTRRGKA